MRCGVNPRLSPGARSPAGHIAALTRDAAPDVSDQRSQSDSGHSNQREIGHRKGSAGFRGDLSPYSWVILGSTKAIVVGFMTSTVTPSAIATSRPTCGATPPIVWDRDGEVARSTVGFQCVLSEADDAIGLGSAAAGSVGSTRPTGS